MKKNERREIKSLFFYGRKEITMSNALRIIKYSEECFSADIHAGILALEKRAWPAIPASRYPEDPALFVCAFVLLVEDVVVSHAAIYQKEVQLAGEYYLAYGVGEVVCDERYRCKGYTTMLLRSVYDFIDMQQADLTIFTCSPARVALYTRIGWEWKKDAVLIGGSKQQPFRSDELGLCVLMKLHSPRALENEAGFVKGQLYLSLGPQRIW